MLSGPQGADGRGTGGALVRMGSPEEAAQALAGVNAWAASTGTGNGSFTTLVKYADNAEERARCSTMLAASALHLSYTAL